MNRSHEHARFLLRRAGEDAYVLGQLAEDSEAASWVLGFHAQQAVEKAVKAVLTNQAIEYPRTHNLSLLLELLRKSEIGLPPDATELPRLTPFAAALRYDQVPQADATELPGRAWALDCARRTIAWAKSLLEEGKERCE